MTESFEITTDAPLNEVLRILRDSGIITRFRKDEDKTSAEWGLRVACPSRRLVLHLPERWKTGSGTPGRRISSG